VQNLITGVSLLLLLLLSPSFSFAASVTVNPTKLFLSGKNKTDVLKVRNEGDAKVTLQVEGVKWSQGEDGKDIYEPTRDIIFFPKIFTIEKGKESLLRVGMKNSKSFAKEASYRIFLQEIPVSKPGETQLLLTLRISVPVFIKPPKELKDWALEKAELSKGLLVVRIKNNGNSHISVGRIKARGLDTSGQEVFQREISGWYVLPGVERAFSVKIPRKDCLNASVIVVSAVQGGAAKEARMDVDKALCPTESEGSAEKRKAGKP
jgi:fimbrial chaperone protein